MQNVRLFQVCTGFCIKEGHQGETSVSHSVFRHCRGTACHPHYNTESDTPSHCNMLQSHVDMQQLCLHTSVDEGCRFPPPPPPLRQMMLAVSAYKRCRCAIPTGTLSLSFSVFPHPHTSSLTRSVVSTISA
ncbi:hypothetical protein QQF64_026620 [Cirrhinus molitorella]|uniref:Uncharacterized protein n=1 Tax=Cirrhinus molitorella TaxID=172907 RepID=A0ABR3NA07_9TELE